MAYDNSRYEKGARYTVEHKTGAGRERHACRDGEVEERKDRHTQ